MVCQQVVPFLFLTLPGWIHTTGNPKMFNIFKKAAGKTAKENIVSALLYRGERVIGNFNRASWNEATDISYRYGTTIYVGKTDPAGHHLGGKYINYDPKYDNWIVSGTFGKREFATIECPNYQIAYELVSKSL